MRICATSKKGSKQDLFWVKLCIFPRVFRIFRHYPVLDSELNYDLPEPHTIQILEAAVKLEEQEWSYQFEASVLEVYNNMLHDLLEPGSGFIADQNAIKHDPTGGHTMVAGVKRVRFQMQQPTRHVDVARVMQDVYLLCFQFVSGQVRSCSVTAANT